jgi:hypothetical protein
MNAVHQQAQNTVEDLCRVFSSCADPKTRDFVAAGISWTGGIPSVVVFSQDQERTRQTIAERLPSLAGLTILHSSPLRESAVADPPAGLRSSVWIGRPLASLQAAVRSWVRSLLLARPITIRPGAQLGTGTVGCALRDQTGKAHFLTDQHVLPSIMRGTLVSTTKGDQVGTVEGSSSVVAGPDWALVAAGSNALPSSCLKWEGCALSLQGPMADGDLALLSHQVIGMSGAKSMERRHGEVVAIGACVAFDRTDNNGGCTRLMCSGQILAMNVPGPKPFGENGDSGAVAYVLPPPQAIGSILPGTAVGLYWLRSPAGDLHALAPLVDVLAAIKAPPSNLDLELWR